jgi:exodeoxyribonuclease I
MAFTLLWYDLETFGRHPQWDRIAQFAAIRTTDTFEEVDPPVVAYCRLTPDYVPSPDACIVNGITPSLVQDRGMPEREFAALIHDEMIRPSTCTVGYNNFRFDDEFIRALFYRCFYDPYRREYAENNSRWDILTLLRMCRDLRPDGIEWVCDDDGLPAFRLEDLARANGIEHERAHDALSDVRATIGLAKLVHRAQRKLFRYHFSLRKKDEVRRRLNLQQMQPLLHTSTMYRSAAGCTTIVIPISVSPANANEIIVCDLRHDPLDWLDASTEEIRRRVFSRKEELGDEPRVPLSGIQTNRCPAIAPLATIDAERARALGLDVDACLRHASLIRDRPDLVTRIRAVYAERPGRAYRDPDLQIYSGDFFPDEDRIEFELIRTLPPEVLKDHPPRLYDQRGPEMLWRYIARNYPESLTAEETARWHSFCASRILTPEPDGATDIGTFKRDVTNRLARIDTPARDKVILKSLLEYAGQLESTVLV